MKIKFLLLSGISLLLFIGCKKTENTPNGSAVIKYEVISTLPMVEPPTDILIFGIPSRISFSNSTYNIENFQNPSGKVWTKEITITPQKGFVVALTAGVYMLGTGGKITARIYKNGVVVSEDVGTTINITDTDYYEGSVRVKYAF